MPISHSRSSDLPRCPRLAPNRLPRLKQLNRIKQHCCWWSRCWCCCFCCSSCFAVKYLEFVFFCLFKGILANCWVTQNVEPTLWFCAHLYQFVPSSTIASIGAGRKTTTKDPFYCHLLAVSNEMSGFPKRQTDTTTSLLLLLTAVNQCWCRCYYFQDFSKRINLLSRQWVRKPDTVWKLYSCKMVVLSKLPASLSTHFE